MTVAASRPASGAALLRMRGVNVAYGSVPVLRGVDLEIRPGEIVALAGANGAGKSTLVRCIAGEIAHTGDVMISGRSVARAGRRSAARRRSQVEVIWQDLALVDDLDIAANLLLGSEPHWFVSDVRAHAVATRTLRDLGIPLPPTTERAGALSGGQRQMLALARAMRSRPQLLILDEPTAALDVASTAQVEALTMNFRRRHGTTVLLISHDIEQVFRVADRILVLRSGRLVTEIDPRDSHPDELAAIMSGQQVDSSARRQLGRLQVLTDRLVTADVSSGVRLILSALADALKTDQVCLHTVSSDRLHLAGAMGLPADLLAAWNQLPLGAEGGPVGLAAAERRTVIASDARTIDDWSPFQQIAYAAGLGSSWSVPVVGSSGLVGVITVLRSAPGGPVRDEIDLVNLYAGYAANAVERERLLDQLTARNRVLETIREVLEALAGPMPISRSIETALQSLRSGVRAAEIAVFTQAVPDRPNCRAHAASDPRLTGPSGPVLQAAAATLGPEVEQLRPVLDQSPDGDRLMTVRFASPDGPATLVARWAGLQFPVDAPAMLEDGAHSLRLALERENADIARQAAAALGRSQQLQRQFLSRLSHELRTPLTAIRGYADSLLQPDVDWGTESRDRFLAIIAAESARLSRLVGDLLDFSAIESGTMRLQPDWCDLPLVVDAARACLAPESASRVTVRGPDDLPAIWADHDRLEQVFVNLMDNAVRHNPPGTRVTVELEGGTLGAGPGGDGHAAAVRVRLSDDGAGLPADVKGGPFEPRRGARSATAGSGLGLSITRGIVEAHGGSITVDRSEPGTSFVISLPVEQAGVEANGGDADA